ncbi:transcriptional regulator [Gilliamella sp. wkB308]|uniref:transcriptional regulator n=1 Tax=Gilliamella sp. wkB308 TaxID=3120263 RepID=UPI00080D9131|nr:transcriptional regulator [Gilliamella apicola]OCF98776.1 hypothetical protein A9G10_06000 [Gilliamella apicola]
MKINDHNLIDDDVLKKFCSINFTQKKPKTIDDAQADSDIVNFLLSNGIDSGSNNFVYLSCLLGLVKYAIIKNINDTNSYGVGYAVGTIFMANRAVGNHARNRLNELFNAKRHGDIFKIYSNYVGVIEAIAYANKKINLSYFCDEISLMCRELTDPPPFHTIWDWGFHIGLEFNIGTSEYTDGAAARHIAAEEVKSVREDFGLTQKQCADMVYVDVRTWQKWELGERKMNRAVYQLFCLKTKILYPKSPGHARWVIKFGQSLEDNK